LRGLDLNQRSRGGGIMSRTAAGQSSGRIHRLLSCLLSKSSSFRADERFISSLCHINVQGPFPRVHAPLLRRRDQALAHGERQRIWQTGHGTDPD